ncbi:MAG TPA: hypothetical protein ENO10_04340 [Salinimicrobium catena]|uniref:Nuclear transport factor 2 family protein n=1 Tax=Salinimicrobium catena TaxID=390640 RepID=A0A7C2R8R9_9FLAO|nr:hypothetical protein [Salinimicrobium catena]
MKNLWLFSCVLMFLFSAEAQEAKTDYPEEVESIETIVSSIFAIISGEKGEEGNWELMRSVFHPEARLMTGYQDELKVFSVEDYITTFRESFYNMTFYEKDVKNKIERFGNLAHVLSTYQAFKTKEMNRPVRTGVASIQLYHDGERWWVLSMYWKNESKEEQVPTLYLPE